MAAFWKPRLSPLLNQTLEGRFVWDLLPGAHRDAWDDAHTYAQRVQIKFYDETSGERKAVSHNVKPLRGQLVNFIVRETLEDLGPLLEWQHPAGYRYDEAASTFDDATRSGVLAFVKS